MKLFTVGHSNLNIESFIALLQRHRITAVADVRSHPYSRHFPHFNQSILKAALLDVRIRYVFLGRELGARPSDPICYVHGKALYERIAATKLFSEGIDRLLKGAEAYEITLMCAEQDPITCHRTILVCQYLPKLDLEINHILKNGELESHQHLEERLLDLHGLNQPEQIIELGLNQLSLFENQSLQVQPTHQLSRRDPLMEAYRCQGDQIAYVEKK